MNTHIPTPPFSKYSSGVIFCESNFSTYIIVASFLIFYVSYVQMCNSFPNSPHNTTNMSKTPPASFFFLFFLEIVPPGALSHPAQNWAGCSLDQLHSCCTGTSLHHQIELPSPLSSPGKGTWLQVQKPTPTDLSREGPDRLGHICCAVRSFIVLLESLWTSGQYIENKANKKIRQLSTPGKSWTRKEI